MDKALKISVPDLLRDKHSSVSGNSVRNTQNLCKTQHWTLAIIRGRSIRVSNVRIIAKACHSTSVGTS